MFHTFNTADKSLFRVNFFHKFVVFKSTALPIITKFVLYALFLHKILPVHLALVYRVYVAVTRS
jgi:hypothetical protein